jgi:hypothetical protein
MRKTASVFVACMMLVAIATPAQAAVFIVYATDGGWYNDAGLHDRGNYGVNYAAGDFNAVETRSFFTFAIPDFLGEVVISATLGLPNPVALSGDPSEVYELFDYTSALDIHADYTATPDVLGQQIFNDLGTGVQYGQAVVTPPSATPVSVVLSAAGRTAIQAAQNGEFVVGGTLTSITIGAPDELLFGNTQTWDITPGTDDDPVLVIQTREPQGPVIPEPATLALLGAGLLAATRRRRRK